MGGKLAWRRLTTCSRMAMAILRNCGLLLPEPIEPADDLTLWGHHQGVLGNILHNDRICADTRITADFNVAQYLGARTHVDVVAQSRPTAGVAVGAGNNLRTLNDDAVLTNCPFDDHAAEIVNDQSRTDLRLGGNADSADDFHKLVQEKIQDHQRPSKKGKSDALNPFAKAKYGDRPEAHLETG